MGKAGIVLRDKERDLKKVFQRLQEECIPDNAVKTDVRFIIFQIEDKILGL